MALSPNYSWAEPDNSSLVKNGASDIRTLGDAIDTSVWNVGFGQAGKNKIINGDFFINQRAFTSSTTNAAYNADRWRTVYTGGTTTTSLETFTAGAAPVAGYEGRKFYRMAITGQSAVGDSVRMQTSIENVTTFAGQTVTYSFWAKASTGTPKLAVEMVQGFGTSGSAGTGTNFGTVTLTTSWARYSVTGVVPSISGKTIGTDSDFLSTRIYASAGSSVSAGQSIGIQNVTFDLWGLQLEYGSKMTPFQTASGGSPQAELAMCQRYYFRNSATATNVYAHLGGLSWYTNSVTASNFIMMPPVTMRTTPTSVEYGGVVAITNLNASSANITALSLNQPTPDVVGLTATVAAVVSTYYSLGANNSATAYIGVSAEL
jgi:hypothetical protein